MVLGASRCRDPQQIHTFGKRLTLGITTIPGNFMGCPLPNLLASQGIDGEFDLLR
jgi:hypothetical protein